MPSAGYRRLVVTCGEINPERAGKMGSVSAAKQTSEKAKPQNLPAAATPAQQMATVQLAASPVMQRLALQVQSMRASPFVVAQRKAFQAVLTPQTGHPLATRGSGVIQRKTAFQTFNDVLRTVAGEIEDTSSSSFLKILTDMAGKAYLHPENAEQNIWFGTAWKGDANDNAVSGDDREMRENLLQANVYGVGDRMRDARLLTDKTKWFTAVGGGEGTQPHLFNAFRQALFFRAERIDSNASRNGFLNYDAQKHGKKGSASVMPGSDAERVKNRADKNLFVTKRRKESSDYAATAQGGAREVLNVIASRHEVNAMQFDVDSGGFKTQNPLTGIVVKAMTSKALANFNTWLPEN